MMGYWFKLTQASCPADLANGTTGKISFRMRNDGVVPIYIKGNRAVVKVALMDNATNVLSTVTLKGVNPFDWKPDETVTQSAEFAFPKNAKGTRLALGVFTKESRASPDIKLGIWDGEAPAEPDTSALTMNTEHWHLNSYISGLSVCQKSPRYP
jgi:hypothetical protein